VDAVEDWKAPCHQENKAILGLKKVPRTQGTSAGETNALISPETLLIMKNFYLLKR
jgi:hypothetical protein